MAFKGLDFFQKRRNSSLKTREINRKYTEREGKVQIRTQEKQTDLVNNEAANKHSQNAKNYKLQKTFHGTAKSNEVSKMHEETNLEITRHVNGERKSYNAAK